MKIVEVFAQDGLISGAEWLARAEGIHRQLRPHLPADYMAKMGRVLKGARMALAVEGDAVLGLAVYRCHENTFDGLKFYIDDLVTDEARRSEGVGHALIAHLEHVARQQGAGGLALDSGTQRTQAHKFYFREGFVIPAFNFKKSFS
ncbi:aminoalkylphosphonic acid N-acetyltransferase [mine drainage metagenome]|uniref:Aminoalkylphosphonic acid N-acetyltransferase n=1 Tax=mine drainage metagenome TaxID=410659 RepID=A0A1J5TI20_9ZZZZ